MAFTAASDKRGTLITVVSCAAFVALNVLIAHNLQKRKTSKKDDGSYKTLSDMARHRGSHIKPPFPPIIRKMLSKCRLAYLSTVDIDESTSHLSLMRFTYLHDATDGEVVIMSTNRNTKKFDMLKKGDFGVALLVHDFHQADGAGEGVYSITLNGTCRIVSDPKRAEHYRNAHLKHNPEYPQFIVGKDVEILCVDVTSARICDINDHVTKWDVSSSSTG